MNLVQAATTGIGSRTAFRLARRLPRQAAYGLGELLFGRVASQEALAFTHALRSNLAIVLGLPEESPEVDRGVRRLLKHTCRSYVDLARAAGPGGCTIAQCCRLQPAITAALDEAIATREGVVLVGAHMCSFDFLLIALSRRFPDVLALTKPSPSGSSKEMNRLRIELGLDLSPASAASLREAVQRLHEGGIVAIAGDVPVSETGELVFFGRASRLSDGFARIALSAGARIMVGLSHRLGDGLYEGFGEFVPPPLATLGRQERARAWAQQCLVRLEALIRRWPDEWLMPEPVWGRGVPGAVAAPAEPPGVAGSTTRAVVRS